MYLVRHFQFCFRVHRVRPREQLPQDLLRLWPITQVQRLHQLIWRMEQSSTTTQIAKAAGVTKDSASSILSAAAPLFMNLLGKQTDGASGSALTGLLSGLVSNIDVGSLLGGLLGGTSSASTTTSTGKKKKKTESSSTGSSLLNGVMNLLK